MSNQKPSNSNIEGTLSEEIIKLSPEHKKIVHKIVASVNYMVSMCEFEEDVDIVTEEMEEIFDRMEGVKQEFLLFRSGKLIV